MHSILRILPVSCCFLFIFSAGYIFSNQSGSKPSPVRAENTFVQTVHYRFTLRNNAPYGVASVRFNCFAPVQMTAGQRCEQIDATHPFERKMDALGNQQLFFREMAFGAYQVRDVSVHVRLVRPSADQAFETVNQSPGRRFPIESTMPVVQRAARVLAKPGIPVTARQIFERVSTGFQFTGYQARARGIIQILAGHQGDCTEFANVFAAFCGVHGIATRRLTGYLLKGETRLRPLSLHDWCEVREGGSWNLADPQQNIFDANYLDYVAIRVIPYEEIPFGEMRTSPRFGVDCEEIFVQMK